MMCRVCRYVDCYFMLGRGADRNRRLYEVRTNEPHNCDFSEPFSCKECGNLIYLDNKVLSPTGKMIPLNYEDLCYHFCDRRAKK